MWTVGDRVFAATGKGLSSHVTVGVGVWMYACVWMYVYACVYTCVYVSCVCVYVCIYMCICELCMCVHMCAGVWVYACVYMCVWVCMGVWVCVHVCVCVRVWTVGERVFAATGKGLSSHLTVCVCGFCVRVYRCMCVRV